MSLLGRLIEALTRRRPAAPATPPPAPPSRLLSVSAVDEQDRAIPGATVVLRPDNGPSMSATSNENGRVTFDVPAAVTGGAWVSVSRDGYLLADQRYDGVTAGEPLPLGDAELNPPRIMLEADVQHRRGVPGLAGRSFIDADGQYLAVGVSLFWAVWGALHDGARLAEELAGVEGRADFARVLCCVGGATWEDRAVSPADVMGGAVGATADLCWNYGVRLAPTIFGGHPETAGSAALRERVVRSVCEQLMGRREALHHVEIANEENDFKFAGGRDELERLARIVREMLPGVPVALTSPLSGDFVGYYEGTGASLATCHLERDVHGTGGVWRPVRQAREAEPLSMAWVNNEPIGIDSSVAADDDPTRLAFAAVMTWVCRGAAYVLHTGAGIRGGGAADRARGRRAGLREQPTFDAALNRIGALRALLPPDLPNWSWQNGNDRFPQFPFETRHDDGGTRIVAPESALLRMFAALAPNGRVVACGIGIAGDVPLVARRRMAFDHYDHAGALVARVELAAGQTYVVRAASGPACLLVGTFL